MVCNGICRYLCICPDRSVDLQKCDPVIFMSHLSDGSLHPRPCISNSGEDCINSVVHMETGAARENIFLAMLVVAITMMMCSAAYEIVVRIAPWMVGKSLNSK